MQPVISVDRLRKEYRGIPAVRDVSFSVQRGEIFGLLGPNGAGKTTTVECLQGLRSRDGGTVSVLGLDPATDGDRLRRRIGAQLQSAALPDRLRVGEAVALFARLRGVAVDLAAKLAEWDLGRARRQAVATLSGGQRQRLFLALALLGDPEVVFLDELTVALDPTARRATWELVRAVRDRGATVVLVTHFMEEAEALCDRVAIVDGGRVVALDTPTALAAEQGGGITVTFTLDGADAAFLAGVPGVAGVAVEDRRVTVHGDGAVAVRVAAALGARGLEPPDYRTHHPTLEAVFVALTGHALAQEAVA